MRKRIMKYNIAVAILLILGITLSCIKEYPEKDSIIFESSYPDTIRLNSPDTIYLKVLSDSTYLYDLYLFENNDTLLYTYFGEGNRLKSYSNHFIYNPQNTGTKNLRFEVTNLISRKSFKISIIVIE